MNWFNRLHDFGDRELVKNSAMKVEVGLRQLEQMILENQDIRLIRGLSMAIRGEVERMQCLSSQLTKESLNCLMIKFREQKISYLSFVKKIQELSERIVNLGGYPLI